MAKVKKEIGLLAEYDSPSLVYHACEKIRDKGYKRFDSYTPFPVHGLDKAMGLGPSYLPWLVLMAGSTGAILAMAFMIWCSVYDYPLNIGGKPVFSIPAFIPITFEVTVLFSGLTAVFGMFALNKLPTFHHPLFNIKRFLKVTDDKFFIMVEASDPKYDEKALRELFEASNASSITVVED